MKRSDAGALVLAVLAGASAWVSLGALAVVNERGMRIGALPPLPALLMLVVGGAIAVWLTRLKTQQAWPLAILAVLWLPWLPIRIPAAFLLWEGPLEIAVWGAAVLGMVMARATVQRWCAGIVALTPQWAMAAVGALFLICAITAAAALQRQIPAGDEPHYLIITQSLLRDGDLRIENNHTRGDYLQYLHTPLPPDFLRRGVDDQIYSIHAPGLPALLLPAFAVGGYTASFVMIALITAVAIALMWRTALLLTNDSAAAWATALGLGFCAPLFFHSFAIFPDPAGAAIVSAALWMLVRFETSLPVTRRQLLGIGAALAFLPWLHTRFSLLAGAAGLVIAGRVWSRDRSWRDMAAFATVPMIAAIAWLLFFQVIYGTPNPAAPYGGSEQNSIVWVPRGLAGLMFDQQFGLLPNAPVLALALLGMIRLTRERRRLAIEVACIALPYVLVVASFGMWWGGWSAPGRFLVPVLPLAVAPLAYAWRDAGRAGRSVFVALVLLGVANIVARVAIADGALAYNVRDGYDLLLEWLSQSTPLALAVPSVHRSGAGAAAAMASVWIAVTGAAAVVLWLTTRRLNSSRSGLWTSTAAAVTVTVIAGTTAGWRLSGVDAERPVVSQLALLARWDGDRTPNLVQLPSARRLQVTEALRGMSIGGTSRAGQPPQDGHTPLLAVGPVPYGSYGLLIEGAQRLSGVLTVTGGVSPLPLYEVPLDGHASGETDIVIRLPVAMELLTIHADAEASARIGRLALRPVSAGEWPGSPTATRAARYGNIRAYFLDDEAFVEPAGVWTRGDSLAWVMIETADRRAAAIDVRAGPVAAVVEFADHEGYWSNRLTLQPGEGARVELAGYDYFSIRTIGGFRPVDHQPGNNDQRFLGVRLEFAP